MSYKIRCYTLFDITRTGIPNRKTPINGSVENTLKWEKQRNTQTNFDTIIQIISLRSQPEEISNIKQTQTNLKEFKHFGFVYDNIETEENVYSFDFTINHHSVFNDGLSELGYLFYDCQDVPMIKVGIELVELPESLDTTPELKNIHFEVLNYE